MTAFKMTRRSVQQRARRLLAGSVAAAAVFFAAACDGLLDVEMPGESTADAINHPQNAALLVLGVQAEYECYLSGFTLIDALMTGEMTGAQLGLGMMWYQHRGVYSHVSDSGTCNGSSHYRPLATARFVADDTYDKISGWSDAEVPNRARLLGQTALYGGFTHAHFAEAYCRAVFDLGPAVMTPEVLQRAEARFTSAIQHATAANDAPTLNAAYVGRARVRLYAGNTAGALADAELVPGGFVFNATRSNAAASRRNRIHVGNVLAADHIVGPAYWDVSYDGVPDGRVVAVDMERTTTDGLHPWWQQRKYTDPSSPIRVASYKEAQLIIAEIQGGQTAVNVINMLHDDWGLPHFNSTDEDEIRAQVIEERRREFWLEGRRMGDLNRYGGWEFWADGVNPWDNRPYEGVRCLPIPNEELQGNPNIS